ncbi:hypothetical protein EDB80DRAFT_594396 [Ilyonectria destructans]|nr:hypothetical protein EDB80DRAFT_594396 [Ilyonectria destructans]
MGMDEQNEADSVTSTIEEEPDSDQEWLVNDVLAEGEVDGTTKYLIDWQGYPLWEASWEPKENLGDVMLADWEESKKKEGHQRKSKQSITAWREAVVARLYGKMERHEKRNLKRAERGLELSVYEKSLEDYLADLERDPKGEEEIEDQKVASTPNTKNPPPSRRGSLENPSQRQLTALDGQAPKKTPTKSPNRGVSDPDSTRRFSGTAAGVREAPSKPVVKSTLRSKLGPYKAKEPPKELEANRPQPVIRETSSGNNNVFAGGKVRKKRPTLLDAAVDPSKKPQLLNSHLTRKLEKGFRDKEGTTAPPKPPSSVFNLNPAERELLSEKAASRLDPITSSTPEEMQIQDAQQPDSDGRTVGESEKVSSAGVKKKKKSVRWGDEPEVQPPAEPEPEASLFINDPFPESYAAEISEQSPALSSLPPPPAATTLSPHGNDDVCLDTPNVTRNARFGPNATVSIPLSFHGTPEENMQHWLSMLEGSETLVFTHACTGRDFWSQAASRPLFRGIVTSCDNAASLTDISERLKVGSLKFIIFEAPTFLEASSLAPISLSLDHGGEDLPPGMRPALFQRVFGFEYSRLLPARLQNTTTKHPFFLAFPRSAAPTSLLLSRWLRACNGDCKIHSSLYPGQWSHFMSLDGGVVIIDEDAAYSIRLFPGLNNLLNSKSDRFMFWIFSKSLRTPTLVPHGSNSFAELGAIRLQPVLEFGTAILVTPSFLVSQPQQACVLLKWLWQSSSKGNIDRYQRARLVMCAGIADWLYELAIEKAEKERSDTSARVQKHGAINHDAVEAMFKTWQIVTKFINEPEDPSPLIFAPESINGNDEQSLVNWFGWWSVMNMNQFRKFSVLGSSDCARAPERLSRHIKRPKFSPSTTDNPDEIHIQHDHEERLKHSTDRQGTTGQSGPEQLTAPRMSLSNQSRELTDFLDSLIGRVGKWCPIELYKFPVSYWNRDMAYHFGDYQSLFTTYYKCFNWLTPFEEGTFPQRNTMAALFYTIEGPWDQALYPQGSMPTRRPWFVVHRPVNVHKKPWRESELLIWDPTPNEKFIRNEVYESDLIEAQREMIQFYDEQNAIKNPNQPIMKVWIAGFNIPSNELTADPMDVTLSYLERFAQDTRFWLPAPDTALPMRGWKMVKPGTAPVTPTPRSPSPDHMDIDEPDKPDEPEQEDGRKMTTVFHPPRGLNPLGSTKCQNRLYQHTTESLRRVRDSAEYHMQYNFRPTTAWYREQQAEHRGFEHVTVVAWQVLFRRYNLPNPEAE